MYNKEIVIVKCANGTSHEKPRVNDQRECNPRITTNNRALKGHIKKMPQSLSKIIVHIVFSTKHRDPVLNNELMHRVHGYVAVSLKDFGCDVYKIGGTEDHIHIACSLPRTITVANLVKDIKVSSCKWIIDKLDHGFAWQKGYGVFSVSQSHLEKLQEYVENQIEHHGTMSFKEELLELLQKYKIAYDDKYLWD
ncbi:MAG: IS200/IS605 family transposase [Kiritimatiellae bacterium]|nr:IS200/IS605 family transposase [Kiritimatiellia bacterium]